MPNNPQTEDKSIEMSQVRTGDKYLAIARFNEPRRKISNHSDPSDVNKSKDEEIQPTNYIEELYGATSLRSGDSSKNEGYISERDNDEHMDDDSDDNDNSVAYAFDGNEFDKRIFEELKDDR